MCFGQLRTWIERPSTKPGSLATMTGCA
jgi:hypothetical protein